MHCLVQSLLRDSSLKNRFLVLFQRISMIFLIRFTIYHRRPMDVTLTGLAASIQRNNNNNNNTSSQPPSPLLPSGRQLNLYSSPAFGTSLSPQATSPHLYGEDTAKDSFENTKQQLNKVRKNHHIYIFQNIKISITSCYQYFIFVFQIS